MEAESVDPSETVLLSLATRRVSVLDSFRGLCALLVALHHFKASGYIATSRFVGNAFLFVDFFFVLSGYVISMRYLEELRSNQSVRRFLARRFWRLYPLHFAALIPFFLIEIFLMPYFAADRVPFSHPMTWEALGLNLLLLNSVNLTHGVTWNYPSWSIGAEALTYLVFAIAVRALGPKSTFFFCLAAIGSLVLVATSSPTYIDATNDYGFFRCVAGFSMGFLICRFASSGCSNAWTARLVRPRATLIEVALIIAVVAFVTAAGHHPANLLSPVLFSVVVYWFSLERGSVSFILSNPWLVALGLISYSVYMVHGLLASRLFSGGLQLVQRYSALKTLSIDGSGRFGATPLQGDLLTVLYVVLVIVTAVFTYRWIELPGQRHFRRRAEGFAGSQPMPVTAVPEGGMVDWPYRQEGIPESARESVEPRPSA